MSKSIYALSNTYTGQRVLATVVRTTAKQIILHTDKPIEGMTEHRMSKNGVRLFGTLSHWIGYFQGNV